MKTEREARQPKSYLGMAVCAFNKAGGAISHVHRMEFCSENRKVRHTLQRVNALQKSS